MKHIGVVAAFLVAAVAAVVLIIVSADSTDAPEDVVIAPTSTRSALPASAPPGGSSPGVSTASPSQPATWVEGLNAVYGNGVPSLISCLDATRDGLLNEADNAGFGAVEIRLIAGQACLDPASHADIYVGAPSAQLTCNPPGPLVIVAVASGGSDLLQPEEGESLGLLPIINGVQSRAQEAGIPTALVLTTAAIFGAEMPQTSMERWLTLGIRARLDGLQCMRAVIVGHSHGGVTVTSITASLDEAFGDRMLGVAIDRTAALYDRPAEELPARTLLLNFFQTNEGWHGSHIEAPNVRNFDESFQRAPVAPSDGGGGDAIVSHKTLDDAPATQQKVVDEIMAWAQTPRSP